MKALRIVIAGAGLFLVLLPFEDRACAEEAADQFDCAACHPMKIRDFKGRRADPVTPVEEYPELPTGRQDIASSPAMCFSCHDGYVMDSRAMWEGGYRGHRLGMPPPSDMVIPELDGTPEFKLNEDGNVYCGTCHSAHVSEADGAPPRVKAFMRQAADGGNICSACHVEKLAIEGSSHDKGGRRNKDFESRGICGYCHAPHGSDWPLMWARDLGKAALPVDQLCRSCHDDAPVPGDHPPHVVAWSQDVRAAIFTNTQGEMPVFDERGRQARVGNIGCATCHDVHREVAEGRPEDLEGLHLRMSEFIEPLCADCHGPESLFKYKFFHSEASRR
jgi:predicted CXXCH cytochrome family protein